MRFSLRARVLALVFALNLAVFGVSGYLTSRLQVEVYRGTNDALIEQVVFTLPLAIQDSGLNVPRILSWSTWNVLEDAILVSDRIEEDGAGDLVPKGVALNPLGRRHRDATFDEQTALAAIALSIRTGEPQYEVLGGTAVPIEGPSDEVWGGLWFRPARQVDEAQLVETILPWFALSTLVLTLVTFFGMRRLVLDPIGSLGEGARRVRSGDLGVRLEEPARRDEMADRVRSFNEMTSTVQGFNARLEEEVLLATEQARRAEAAAMTQRRLAAMGELAAGIAHEINNPLGGLLNAVQALERPDLEPAKRKRYLELLSTGLARIGDTVNRLRRFTPRPSEFEPVDLCDVLRDSLDLLRHRAERLSVSIEESLEPGVETRIQGARNEIGQALLNLLTNALDALESTGRGAGRLAVTLEARTDDGLPGVLLAVEDDGPGVDAEELERVQDLFYTTKEVGKGTGLGLPLVHSTLQKHGGTVQLSSEPGSYFRVELWFPLDGSPSVSDARER